MAHELGPVGRFTAVSTRDATALARDGHPFYALNWLESSTEPVAEVQFADGVWMLAAADDLDFAPAALSVVE